MANKGLELKKIRKILYFIDDWSEFTGKNKWMTGDCSEIWGNCSNIRGNCSLLRGDCSGLKGNCTGIKGNCTGLSGNLDNLGITDEERKRGVNIEDLVVS